MSRTIIGIVLAILFSFPQKGTAQATFTCKDAYYLSLYVPPNPVSGLFQVEILNNTANFNLNNNITGLINSIGYNRLDNLIYGFNTINEEIVQLDANGNTVNYGAPTFPADSNWIAGDVDKSGTFHMVNCNNEAWLVSFDVSNNPAVITNQVRLQYANGTGAEPYFLDIAFDPATNLCYGFDENLDNLCTIDPITGDVSLVGATQPHPFMERVGALFFSALGKLYGYGNGRLWNIDLTTGDFTLINNGPPTFGNDGASCPYQLTLIKDVESRRICPGDTVDYYFILRNTTGLTQTGINIEDRLPAQYKIVAFNKIFGGVVTAGTGPGTQELSIESMTIPDGVDTLIVSIAVDNNFSGSSTFKNQAILVLPILNDTIFSDDPNTPLQLYDSTTVEILPKELSTNIATGLSPLCVGDDLLLIGTVRPNSTYHWTGPRGFSDSNRTVSIELTPANFGTYTLTAVESQCTVIKDSVLVEKNNDCENEYPCVDRFKLSQYDFNRDSLDLFHLNYNGNVSFTDVSTHFDSIDAIGYSRNDRFVYGFDNRNRQINRLFATDGQQLVGTPPAIVNATGDFEAGAFNAANIFYLTGSAGFIAGLDVSSDVAVMLSQTPLQNFAGQTPQFGDIAFSPADDRCFGFDENTNRLVVINPTTGAITAIGPSQFGIDINALFFNTLGNLFGYGGGELVGFDINTGQATRLGSGNSSTIEDGCNCPYDLKLYKAVSDTAVCPGDTVSYTITFANRTGQTIQRDGFRDNLPTYMTITSLQNNTNGILAPGSGVGSNLIRIVNINIPPDTSTIKFQAVVDENFTSGDLFLNQAFFFDIIPRRDTTFSDYTFTFIEGDPTPLRVYPVIQTDTNITICPTDSVFAGGNWQSAPGTFRDTFASIVGCDSIVSTTISLEDAKRDTISFSICASDSVFASGAWRFTSGVYMDSSFTASGCDSISTSIISVLDTSRTVRNIDICQGDSLLVGGNFQTNSGLYFDTLSTFAGCDSILVTNLNVTNQIEVDETRFVCQGDSILVFGQWVSNAGNFMDTTISVAGCDSITTIAVILDSVANSSVDTVICEGDSVLLDGEWQFSPGTYTDTFSTIGGCDSIVTTQLSVLPIARSSVLAGICEGDSVFTGNSWKFDSGNYFDTLIATNGCDSIVETEVEIFPSYADTIQASICEGQEYLFFGDTIIQSGTYMNSVQTQDGCDSITFLELEVLQNFEQITDTTICNGENILFRGISYSQSGNYGDTIQNATGCDSIFVLNLNMQPLPQPDLGMDTLLCDLDSFLLSPGDFAQYKWQNGTELPSYFANETGTFYVNVLDSTGCQGGDTIKLEFRDSPFLEFGPPIEQCPGFSIILSADTIQADSFLWNTGSNQKSITVENPNTYSLTVTNGCPTSDSVEVSTYPTDTAELGNDELICEGDTVELDASTPSGNIYQWSNGASQPNIRVFESGLFTVEVIDIYGCITSDSIKVSTVTCFYPLPIPTAFTPNNDGKNDRFFFELIEQELLEVKIFDRWGNQLYSADGTNFNGWDGRVNGELSQLGVYVCVVRYISRAGEEKIYSGNITLIR